MPGGTFYCQVLKPARYLIHSNPAGTHSPSERPKLQWGGGWQEERKIFYLNHQKIFNLFKSQSQVLGVKGWLEGGKLQREKTQKRGKCNIPWTGKLRLGSGALFTSPALQGVGSQQDSLWFQPPFLPCWGWASPGWGAAFGAGWKQGAHSGDPAARGASGLPREPALGPLCSHSSSTWSHREPSRSVQQRKQGAGEGYKPRYAMLWKSPTSAKCLPKNIQLKGRKCVYFSPWRSFAEILGRGPVRTADLFVQGNGHKIVILPENVSKWSLP